MNKQKYQPVFYTVWQDVWTSMTSPRHYLKWAFQPLWRSMKYLMFLQAVMAVVITIVFYNQVSTPLNQFATWGTENLPTITFEDRSLQVVDDETLLFSDSDKFFFKLDVTQSLEEEPMIDPFYEAGLLIVKDGAVVSTSGNREVFEYSEFPDISYTLSPETVSEQITSIKRFILFVFPVAAFIGLVVSRLIIAAFFSFFMVLFSGFKLKYKQVLNLAIYALTPATLVEYLSVALFSFSGIYTFVFVIYFVLAVTYLRKFVGLNVPKP